MMLMAEVEWPKVVDNDGVIGIRDSQGWRGRWFGRQDGGGDPQGFERRRVTSLVG